MGVKNWPLTSPSLLFNKEFMEKWDVPGWGKQMREAMAAPPLPVLSRNWDLPQRKIVGDCLAKRVAANIKTAPRLDVQTIASSALTEFGLSIHAVSTCLHSVILGAQQAAEREAKMASEAETLRAALAEKDTVLKETSDKMSEELCKAKEFHAAQQSEMQKLRGEVAEKSLAAEKAEKAKKAAEDNLAAVRVDFENSLKSAEEKARAAEEKATKAVTEYKDCDEFWDLLIESYDLGVFHMARCFRRATDRGLTPTLEDLAAYVLEDPFSAELVAYHPVYPFKSSEIDEHLAECRKKKKPETVFPEILDRNLRVSVADLEAARKAKAKADAAAKAKDRADVAAKKAAETDGAGQD